MSFSRRFLLLFEAGKGDEMLYPFVNKGDDNEYCN